MVSTRCPFQVNNVLYDRKHHTHGILTLRSLKYTLVWSLAPLKRLDVHRRLKCLLLEMDRDSGEWWLNYRLFLCSWKRVLHSYWRIQLPCAPWDNSEITVLHQLLLIKWSLYPPIATSLRYSFFRSLVGSYGSLVEGPRYFCALGYVKSQKLRSSYIRHQGTSGLNLGRTWY